MEWQTIIDELQKKRNRHQELESFVAFVYSQLKGIADEDLSQAEKRILQRYRDFIE